MIDDKEDDNEDKDYITPENFYTCQGMFDFLIEGYDKYGKDYKEYGFNLDLLYNRDDIYVNLIYFDLKMINPENYEYYNTFKFDFDGGFFAIDDLQILKKLLEEIKKEKIPFIVLSSGSSGKDVIKICKKYSFIKEVIIFCENNEYNKYKNYMKDYKGYVKKVLTSFGEVYQYLRYYKFKNDEFNVLDSFIFSYEDIKMNKQLEQIPVISALEYDNYFFLIHRVYAHYFGKMDDKINEYFTESRFDKIKGYIYDLKNIKEQDKEILISRLKLLVDKKNFAELAIREYTRESGFCYIFNQEMTKFRIKLFPISYFMGPFLFSVNKYIYDYPEKFGFNEDMILYKNIQCSIYDFFFYKMNLNHIICFPSIISTYTIRGNFTPTSQNKSLKNKLINYKDLINVTMIFNYKHNIKNKSPGIIVKDNKASDGQYISTNPNENEVILFPFTFVRITKINNLVSKKEKIYEIYLDIINREEYIEYTLKNKVHKRIKFSSLE